MEKIKQLNNSQKSDPYQTRERSILKQCGHMKTIKASKMQRTRHEIFIKNNYENRTRIVYVQRTTTGHDQEDEDLLVWSNDTYEYGEIDQSDLHVLSEYENHSSPFLEMEFDLHEVEIARKDVQKCDLLKKKLVVYQCV